ncbi:RNA ligase [Enhygromyxa salina]|uniref:RNA ligase n=1 Tax=Enhygromyxa salina TaxID=215803 RepID=A0A2S9YE12_9BACT|nr:RNA ligase family protein [Enhygromyxa salina]PRQ03358.1 RNA ligase [Enhygromyxa salina]
MQRHKYPRTRHLPWSPGATRDDLIADGVDAFVGQRVIVTEKMDGENTTFYRDHTHARSIDSRHHPSRDWIKGLHGRVAHLIPEGWRICGENLYARHSLSYEALPSYFMLFSVWDADNRCLDWDSTLGWAKTLGVETVPTLYDGVFARAWFEDLRLDLAKTEGYVVRRASGFAYAEFGQHVAKWVRSNHVQTDQHWMSQAVVPNKLARS